jgi:hypothetical protein
MRIKAAFESWYENQRLNLSPLILESKDGVQKIEHFIDNDQNAVAKLHTYHSEMTAKAEYSKLRYIVNSQK